MQANDFIIQDINVNCPACHQCFATPSNSFMAEMTKDTPVAADLHRILPYAAVRASLIAMCPYCVYTWWISAFKPDYSRAKMVLHSPVIDHPKKFAHAVQTGRDIEAHSLDKALLALNGYWCAWEAGQNSQEWLELSIKELGNALVNQDWQGNRSRYHYILAELLRSAGDFVQAIKHYDRVDITAKLPSALVSQQRKRALAQNPAPAILAPEFVEEIFFPQMKLVSLRSNISQQAEWRQMVAS
jgi:hypothetical protein